MTLQPLPPEFPYIWGKFNFLFISVVMLLKSNYLAIYLHVFICVIGSCCQPSVSIAYLPGCSGGGQSSDTWEHLFLSYRFSWAVLRSNRAVGFAWIWIGIRFVNKCSQTQNHHHFHHLSSPSVIIFEEAHHLFQPRSESKLFCFLPWFCQALLDFAKSCSEFSLLICINFTMRISVWKAVWVSCSTYVDFRAYFFKSCLLELTCDIVY
jgi:hypothetical protein